MLLGILTTHSQKFDSVDREDRMKRFKVPLIKNQLAEVLKIRIRETLTGLEKINEEKSSLFPASLSHVLIKKYLETPFPWNRLKSRKYLPIVATPYSWSKWNTCLISHQGKLLASENQRMDDKNECLKAEVKEKEHLYDFLKFSKERLDIDYKKAQEEFLGSLKPSRSFYGSLQALEKDRDQLEKILEGGYPFVTPMKKCAIFTDSAKVVYGEKVYCEKEDVTYKKYLNSRNF